MLLFWPSGFLVSPDSPSTFTYLANVHPCSHSLNAFRASRAIVRKNMAAIAPKSSLRVHMREFKKLLQIRYILYTNIHTCAIVHHPCCKEELEVSKKKGHLRNKEKMDCHLNICGRVLSARIVLGGERITCPVIIRFCLY